MHSPRSFLISVTARTLVSRLHSRARSSFPPVSFASSSFLRMLRESAFYRERERKRDGTRVLLFRQCASFVLGLCPTKGNALETLLPALRDDVGLHSLSSRKQFVPSTLL